MRLSFVTLDVFTMTRYAGNPLAIVHVPTSFAGELTQQQKQAVAKEFNLSEIVFFHEFEVGSTTVTIDIFTSIAEIPFAGHPTIGTVFYLLNVLRLSRPPTQLLTKAGYIPISLQGTSLVSASIPHDVHVHSVTHLHPLSPYGPCPVVSIVRGMTFILVQLHSLKDLGSVSAGIKTLEEVYNPSSLDPDWQKGLVGTLYYVNISSPNPKVSMLRTRMFSSREDPATGSASCALAAYLSINQTPREQDQRLSIYHLVQGVEMGRESHIDVQVSCNVQGDIVENVLLGGQAVKVMEGTLEV